MPEQGDIGVVDPSAGNPPLRQTLLAALKIEPGEGRALGLLIAFAFCIGLVQVSFFSASSALFLTTYGSGVIPWVYIASAVVASAAGAGFYRVERRWAPVRLLTGTLLALLVSIAVLRISLDATDARWPAFVLLAWFPVISAMMTVVLWTLAGNAFDVRQGKRLFGLVGGGDLLASVLGGVLTPAFVARYGVENLLWVSLGGILMCLGTMLATIRWTGDGTGDVQSGRDGDAAAKPRVRFRDLVGSSYVRTIFLVYLMSSMTYRLVDFTFYGQAQIRFHEADELARFFGLFFGLTQAVTLVLVTFVTGRVMSRLGIHVGKIRRYALLACLSVMVVAHFAHAEVAVLFLLAALTKLVDLVCVRAVTAPVFPVLYQVLPRSRKIAVQVSLESIIAPVAGGVVGCLLLVVAWAGGTGTLWLNALALAAIGGWFAANRSMAPEYQKALSQALVSRTLEGGAMIYDASMVDILKDRLKSPHPGEAIYALDLLDKVADEEASDHYGVLMEHAAPEVRLAVLERIRRERPPGLDEAVQRVATGDRDPRVRGEGLRAFSALREADAVDVVSPYLDHPDAVVRRGAMSGLLRYGGIEGVLAAGQALIRMEGSRSARDRAFTASVLGDVGITSFYRPLVRLLQDGDPDVRTAALGAAGEVKNSRLWPEMMRNLAHPRYHAEAAQAFVRAGRTAVPALSSALASPERQPEIKVRVAAICGRIGGEEAAATLVRHMGVADRRIRHGVLEALRVTEYRAAGVAVVDIRRLLRQEASEIAWMLRAGADVEREPACRPLLSALRYGVEQARHRCFVFLSFLYDARTILRAEENLNLRASQQRAYALEVLQETVSRDLYRILSPVLERLSPGQRLQQLCQTFPQERMSDLARSSDVLRQSDLWVHPWVKATACYAVSQVGGGAARDALASALSDEEQLVRETAIWAIGQMDAERALVHCERMMQDSDERVVGAAEAVKARIEGRYAMLLTIERVLVLKSVAIFEGVPDEVLSALAAVMEEFDIRAGATVYEKGGTGRTMFIIVSGEVRVHDEDRTFVNLKERDFFGELTTLDPAPHSASTSAVTDTRLLGLDRDALYELMSDYPAVLRKIIHELCERLRGKRR